MRFRDAKKLKWGTPLMPTKLARTNLKEHRKAIFLGTSGTHLIKVVRVGTKEALQYDPTYWKLDVDRL